MAVCGKILFCLRLVSANTTNSSRVQNIDPSNSGYSGLYIALGVLGFTFCCLLLCC